MIDTFRRAWSCWSANTVVCLACEDISDYKTLFKSVSSFILAFRLYIKSSSGLRFKVIDSSTTVCRKTTLWTKQRFVYQSQSVVLGQDREVLIQLNSGGFGYWWIYHHKSYHVVQALVDIFSLHASSINYNFRITQKQTFFVDSLVPNMLFLACYNALNRTKW